MKSSESSDSPGHERDFSNLRREAWKREVTGPNPAEVLNFSGFSTQFS